MNIDMGFIEQRFGNALVACALGAGLGASPSIAQAPDSTSKRTDCIPSSPTLLSQTCGSDDIGGVEGPLDIKFRKKTVTISLIGNSLVNRALPLDGNTVLEEVITDFVRRENPDCDPRIQTDAEGKNFAANGAKFEDVYNHAKRFANSVGATPPRLNPSETPNIVVLADGTNDGRGTAQVSGDTMFTYQATAANIFSALTSSDDGSGMTKTVHFIGLNDLPRFDLPNNGLAQEGIKDTNVEGVAQALRYAANMPIKSNLVKVTEVNLRSLFTRDDIQLNGIHPDKDGYLKLLRRIDQISDHALTCRKGTKVVDNPAGSVVHLPTVFKDARTILASTHEENARTQWGESWNK